MNGRRAKAGRDLRTAATTRDEAVLKTVEGRGRGGGLMSDERPVAMDGRSEGRREYTNTGPLFTVPAKLTSFQY